jgi:hypothetical protein
MPHVAELSYPGRWLDHDDHEWSLRVENRFHHLERFLAEAAIALNLFEGAMRERERGKRGNGAVPETYEHLAPYVHARAFVAALDDIAGWLADGDAARNTPPRSGMLVLEERKGTWYALRCGPEGAREVEVSTESLFRERDRIQCAIRALPWRGPCRHVP